MINLQKVCIYGIIGTFKKSCCLLRKIKILRNTGKEHLFKSAYNIIFSTSQPFKLAEIAFVWFRTEHVRNKPTASTLRKALIKAKSAKHTVRPEIYAHSAQAMNATVISQVIICYCENFFFFKTVHIINTLRTDKKNLSVFHFGSSLCLCYTFLQL